jgi:hypothetical protein
MNAAVSRYFGTLTVLPPITAGTIVPQQIRSFQLCGEKSSARGSKVRMRQRDAVVTAPVIAKAAASRAAAIPRTSVGNHFTHSFAHSQLPSAKGRTHFTSRSSRPLGEKLPAVE